MEQPNRRGILLTRYMLHIKYARVDFFGLPEHGLICSNKTNTYDFRGQILVKILVNLNAYQHFRIDNP